MLNVWQNLKGIFFFFIKKSGFLKFKKKKSRQKKVKKVFDNKNLLSSFLIIHFSLFTSCNQFLGFCLSLLDFPSSFAKKLPAYLLGSMFVPKLQFNFSATCE